jgi:hypothetical protein
MPWQTTVQVAKVPNLERGELHRPIRPVRAAAAAVRVRQEVTGMGVEKLPLILYIALGPEELPDVDLLLGILVTALVMPIARPKPHWFLCRLPPEHQIDPEAAPGDVIDRCRAP